MTLPKVEQEFFPLGGGLDLLTPAIALGPGRCFDAQNYEPEIAGGYRRLDGYERYDGRTSPTTVSYWVLPAAVGTLAVGNTVTGVTSAATGLVLGIVGPLLILGRVTGIFAVGESLGSGATVTSAMLQNGAQLPSDDADYQLLATNDARRDILIVPGSGPIRGVRVYNDTVYAFRDNAAGTAGNLWKATPTGWSQIAFGSEIQFNQGLAAGSTVYPGATITGGTSGATALVKTVLLRVGSWGTAAIGAITVTPVSGTFGAGEPLKLGATQFATTTTGVTAITRLPGGRLEFDTYNFTGSTLTSRMYGADGVNLAFEFDGTNYVPIRTGMAVDTPQHIKGHKLSLFLSFIGSVQFSAIGNPYAWTVVLGAGEIAVGEAISGFIEQGGSYNSGSTLMIFTSGKTHTLYGTSSADYRLVTSISDIGYYPYTTQLVSSDAFGMTGRGIQALITTLNFGDFEYASISHEIQPYITAHRGKEIASTALKSKNQYRVYFNDGSALAVGLTGDKVSALMPLDYGRVVRCIDTTTLTTGREVTFFGSDDGYIYQDSTGTSFDGVAVEAWVRLAFNHNKSPRVRKRYRRAILEGKIAGFAKINLSYDLGYGNPNVQPSATREDTVLLGGGGYWDQFIWDQFTWDTQVVMSPSFSLDGTEKSIALLFYSNRAQDRSHTLQGVTLAYTSRRLER
jgi:hypothetical protein